MHRRVRIFVILSLFKDVVTYILLLLTFMYSLINAS